MKKYFGLFLSLTLFYWSFAKSIKIVNNTSRKVTIEIDSSISGKEIDFDPIVLNPTEEFEDYDVEAFTIKAITDNSKKYKTSYTGFKAKDVITFFEKDGKIDAMMS